MEVHAHTHTARKKWTHYFWEFFMLFLAVFCGFLAENQREHFVEHKREKQYIRSMIEDLKADTSKLEFIIYENQLLLVPLDTLRYYFDEIDKGFNNPFIRNLYGLNGFDDFHPTDRTIQQLKNGGNMRLIRNMSASDSIMDYDASIHDILLEAASLGTRYEHITVSGWGIIDYNKVVHTVRTKGQSELQTSKESFLLTDDKLTLGKYFNEVSFYRGILFSLTESFKKLKDKAIKLIIFLKKEYHLE